MANVPGARFKVGLGGSGEKYQLALNSEDPLALAAAAAAIEKDLRTIPGLGNIAQVLALMRPEVAIRPNFSQRRRPRCHQRRHRRNIAYRHSG